MHTLIGDLPGYGTVYYNPNGIANILSLSNVEKAGREVSYDTSKGGCFRVHNPSTNKTIEFKQQGKIFVYDTRNKEKEYTVSFLNTVEQNKKLFSPRQYKRAVEARELHGMLGMPSQRDFINALKRKLVPNTHITAEDVENAEFIWGKHLGIVQGKTRRMSPLPVVSDYIQVPPDFLTVHQNVTLAADVMFVSKVPFFVTVSRNIKFFTGQRLPDRKKGTLVSALLKVVGLYRRRGFDIEVCNLDNEFECLEQPMLKRKGGIPLNICAKEEHVPEIERGIQTIKGRIRGALTTLPFKKIPRVMCVNLVLFCILMLNMFPPIGGASTTFAP